MKFGLESEKFLYNLKENRPSKGVFSFLDALKDYEQYQGSEIGKKVTNEFVLNLIEIATFPSHSPLEVLKDYIFSHLLLQSVANRENVALVPLASLPVVYNPQMTPKWPYYVQNSILDNRRQDSWMLSKSSPLLAAGNCAGVHVHTEIETPHEFLFSNRELINKFNMGLMLTPMIAFSSSPYFFGIHEAHSMRGLRYYGGVYKKFPLNGGLPPVMNSSEDVLRYTQSGLQNWIGRGIDLGFSSEELLKLTSRKGANWGPIRWNGQWNTIEIRCLESDRIDFDCSKFIWMVHAMKRMDIRGESLQCKILNTRSKIDKHMIEDCFEVSGNEVSILETVGINELFTRAIQKGTQDDLVEQYLYKMSGFAQVDLQDDYRWAFEVLQRVLHNHSSSSQKILSLTHGQRNISENMAIELIHYAIDDQKKVIRAIREMTPDIFTTIDQNSHHL